MLSIDQLFLERAQAFNRELLWRLEWLHLWASIALVYATEGEECSLCGVYTSAYCSTLACPSCHKSLTFEECTAE